MDFALSDKQKNIQWAAEQFAKGEFNPDLGRELDQIGKFPDSIWQKACQLGFVGIRYPREFGGSGLGVFENCLVVEAFCRVHSGIGTALTSADLGSEVLLRFGSPDQKRQCLASLIRGEKKWTVAFSESENVRDLSQISTMAQKCDTAYVLTGRKRFVPYASVADRFIILAKETKGKWISLIVGKGDRGVEVHPIEMMGSRMIGYGDLELKEVSVPFESRIGEEGEGDQYRRLFLYEKGLKGASQALGMAQGAFDRAIQYARQREQFGRRLSELQAIRHKLADMAVSVEAARWLTYKSAVEYDQGRTDPGSLSIAQLEAGRRLIWVVDEALQIFGGYGYMADQEIEENYRDAWAIGADLGTEEENKDDIAEKILGG